MRFEQPLMLLGLLLLPLLALLLVWGGRRRQRALARLGDLAQVVRLIPTVNARGRRWRERLWLLAVAAVIVALARPQWGTTTEVVRQEGVQIMVVLDISSSMLAQDVQPNRLTRAKQAIDDLLRTLSGDQVGLVLFSGASFIQFPLTTDYATARAFLLSANPDMISRQGTALADAIRTAESGFSDQRNSQQVILIVTDGENHEGDTLAAARAAADDNSVIFALGLGTPEGAPVPEYDPFGNLIGFKQDRNGQIVQSRLDEETLRQLTAATGGDYFRATAAGSEIGVLADIIGRLDAAELDGRFELQAIERFQLFVLIALVALLAAELIPERRRPAAEATALPLNGAAPKGAAQPSGGANLLALLLVGGLLVGCGVNAAQMVADGNEQFAGGAYDEALAAYSEARAAGADGSEPVYNIGNSQYRLQEYAAAQDTLLTAGEQADGALAAASAYNLGNAYFAEGRWAEAVAAYREALRRNPDDLDAKINLELAQARLNPSLTITPSPTPTPTPTPEPGSEEQPGEQEQPIDQPQENSTATPTPAPDTPEPDSPDSGNDPQPTATAENPDGTDAPDDPSIDDPSANDGTNDATPTPQPTAPPPPSAGQPAGRLTQEQARRLLDAIGQDVDTLQERLQQILIDDRPEGQDW